MSINAEVIKNVNGLNPDAVLKKYSTDVKSINADGSISDYQSLSRGLTESFEAAKFLKFTKMKEDFEFLSKTMILCTWNK